MAGGSFEHGGSSGRSVRSTIGRAAGSHRTEHRNERHPQDRRGRYVRRGGLIAKAKHRLSIPILATAQVQVTPAGLKLRYTDYDLFREVIIPCDDGFDSDRAVQISPVTLAGLLKGCKGEAAVTVSDAGVTVAVGSRTLSAPAAGDAVDFRSGRRSSRKPRPRLWTLRHSSGDDVRRH